MKTRLIFTAIIALALTSTSLFAQIKIISNLNVGVGTDTPAEKLHINGSVRGNQSGALRINTGSGYTDIGPKNTSFAHLYTDRARYYFNKEIIVNEGCFSSYNNQNLYLQPGRQTKVTILASGNVGIGGSYPSYKLEVFGQAGATQFITTSDERLKKDIQPLESGIDEIIKLKPVSFKYSAEEFRLKKSLEAKDNIEISDSANVELDSIDLAFCNSTKFGFSAQDMQEVYPELVTADNYGYLSIDYNGIIPILVNAIKEQQLKIEELEAQIAKLSGIKSR